MESTGHKCTANDRGLRIEWNEKAKRWYLKGIDYWAIYHCPYCGLKLEPPDVKIPVSRKRLQRWINQLWKAHGNICNNDRQGACLTIEETMNNIKAEIRNNDWP